MDLLVDKKLDRFLGSGRLKLNKQQVIGSKQ